MAAAVTDAGRIPGTLTVDEWDLIDSALAAYGGVVGAVGVDLHVSTGNLARRVEAVKYRVRAIMRHAEPECRCVHDCADDPATACSLSGDWHVHPDDGTGTFGACPAHPDAPGDL